MRTFLLVALLAAVALAGCNDDGGSEDGGDGSDGGQTTAPIKAGKGAISGLLINDVFRPVPGGLILIQELGLTATSDASGQFGFADIEPGSYILRVQVDGHEAAPQNVEVKEGEYSEPEIIARRVFNQAGRIITNEYSVFVPCSAGFIVNGITMNCVFDLSGDSYRSSFTSNLTSIAANVTYMVTEWKFNQVGDWNGQVREDDGTPQGGDRYAVVDITQGDYGKAILQPGVLNEEANGQNNNVPWDIQKEFATAIFLNGQFKAEAQDAYDNAKPVCDATSSGPGEPAPDVLCTATGLGAAFGVKAKIVQSIFIDEPEVDVPTYCVLC